MEAETEEGLGKKRQTESIRLDSMDSSGPFAPSHILNNFYFGNVQCLCEHQIPKLCHRLMGLTTLILSIPDSAAPWAKTFSRLISM